METVALEQLRVLADLASHKLSALNLIHPSAQRWSRKRFAMPIAMPIPSDPVSRFIYIHQLGPYVLSVLPGLLPILARSIRSVSRTFKRIILDCSNDAHEVFCVGCDLITRCLRKARDSKRQLTKKNAARPLRPRDGTRTARVAGTLGEILLQQGLCKQDQQL
jgi:hypothetical protein